MRFFRIHSESVNGGRVFAKQFFDRLYGAISHSQPDELGRTAVQQTARLEIRILGDKCKSVLLRILPDFGVVCIPKPHSTHVCASLVQFVQKVRETW